METNRDRQAKFNIHAHLEKRRREKAELYKGDLVDVSLHQKKNVANTRAFQHVNNIDELPAGLMCAKCKGTCDKLTLQFQKNQPIQLCASCCELKDKPNTREKMFQQSVVVGGKMQQYERQYVCEKQVVIFASSRKSTTDQIPQESYKSLQNFIQQSSFWEEKCWQDLPKMIVTATATASCLADAQDMDQQISDAPPNGIAIAHILPTMSANYIEGKTEYVIAGTCIDTFPTKMKSLEKWIQSMARQGIPLNKIHFIFKGRRPGVKDLTVDNWHLSAAEMLQEIQQKGPGTMGWKEEARLKTEALGAAIGGF